MNQVLAMLGLGSLGAASGYWIMGWFGGFHLYEKLSSRAKKVLKWLRILSWLTLGSGAAVAGIATMRACGAVSPAAAAMNGGATARSLGKVSVATPTEFLKRLKIAEAKRDAQAKAQQKVESALQEKVQKQMAEIQRDPVSHVQSLRIHDLQKTEQSPFLISQNSEGFIYKKYDGAVMRWTFHGGDEELAPAVQQPVQQWTQTISSGAVMMMSSGGMVVMGGSGGAGYQKIGTRKGPFCRVTCEFHHRDNYTAGGTGDVEVDADYCNKNVIPPEAYAVPGWYQVDAEYEQKREWPGPAQGGLDHYKLYWTSPPAAEESKGNNNDDGN